MEKKIISIDEIKEQKKLEEIPDVFVLGDVSKFTNMILYALNSFYELALEGEVYHSVCTQEQLNILTSVYSSFFTILYSEYDKYIDGEENERIISVFLTELYKITRNLPDAEEIKKNIDKNVLKFKKND